MAKPKKPSKSPKKPRAPKKSVAPAGPAARWLQALLAAGLGALIGTWALAGAPTDPEAALALAQSPEVLAGTLAFGTAAAWALAWGFPGGLAGGACGLALAGLAAPVALSATNWGVLAVGAALGLAARGPSQRPALRPAAFLLVHVGLAALLGPRGAPWIAASAAAVLAAHLPLPLGPEWQRRGLIVGMLAVLAGAGRTVDAGFVRITVDMDRALLAEWDNASRVLPARSRSVFWVGATKPIFRATNEGPSFLQLPPVRPGPALPARQPDAVDLAELGFAPQCEPLAQAALAGDTRARVQAVLRGCEVDLRSLAATDVALDGAYVLRGQRAMNATALLSEGVELPLNEPGAVILAAKVRLKAPKAAAQALVDGGPMDRAILLGQLSTEDRALLREVLTEWSAEVPGPVGQPYRDALDAVSR